MVVRAPMLQVNCLSAVGDQPGAQAMLQVFPEVTRAPAVHLGLALPVTSPISNGGNTQLMGWQLIVRLNEPELHVATGVPRGMYPERHLSEQVSPLCSVEPFTQPSTVVVVLTMVTLQGAGVHISVGPSAMRDTHVTKPLPLAGANPGWHVALQLLFAGRGFGHGACCTLAAPFRPGKGQLRGWQVADPVVKTPLPEQLNCVLPLRV